MFDIILLYADYDDILSFSATCKEGFAIYMNPQFWINKAMLDFNIPANSSQQYVKRYIEKGFVSRNSRCFLSDYDFITRALCFNKLYLLEENKSLQFTTLSLQTMLQYGHIELFKKYYDRERNSIFNRIKRIFRGDDIEEWATLLKGAILSGKIEIFSYINNMKPETYEMCYDPFIFYAIRSGNIEMYDTIREKCGGLFPTAQLVTAVKCGDIPMYAHIRKLYLSYAPNYDLHFTYAREFNQPNMVNYIGGFM
jgi:hypothetical protein